MTTPKALKQQQLAPTISCDGRPTKTAQHLLMENKNSALIVERKVMDSSHQPASGEVNAQHLITRANTVTTYITLRPFVTANIKPSQHLWADQQTHHAHQPPRQMRMRSSLTTPSLTIHPTESSSIHSSSTANNSGQCSVSLDHHTYNQLTDTWIRQASKPQPFIRVTATISSSDYTAFGLNIAKPTNPSPSLQSQTLGAKAALLESPPSIALA